MIAEILDSKASFSAVINYNERVVREGKGEILSHHNMITFNSQERIAWLEAAAKINTRIKNPVFHAALAFDYSDRVNNAILDQIGHEYMEHMGYANCSYLVYRHEDKKHTHIHVVGSRVDQEGKKVNDSFEQYRSESLCRNLEIKYQLRQLGEGLQLQDTPISRIQSRVWDKEKPVYSRINNEIQFILKEFRPSNFDEFKSLTKRHYIEVQERRGEGGRITGLVYAIIYENGVRDHKGVAGGSFKHDYSMRGLGKIFEKNAGRAIEENSSARKRDVFSVHDKAFLIREVKALYEKVLSDQLMSEAQFAKNLRAFGVIPIFARNSNGYYGVSFRIPAKEDMVIKASDLDRTLSFNVIKGRIIRERELEGDILSLMGQLYKSTWKVHDVDQRVTDRSITVFLKRIGFQVQIDGTAYVLKHPAFPTQTLKISFVALNQAIGEEVLLSEKQSSQHPRVDQMHVHPFNTAQWKFVEDLASGDTVKIVPLLLSPAFYKTNKLALHPEEISLFGPQIDYLEKLKSFQARLYGSIRLIIKMSNDSPERSSMEIYTDLINTFAKAGITLFADQRGNWLFKDYQLREGITLKQLPLSEKDLALFLQLTSFDEANRRLGVRPDDRPTAPVHNTISFELLAALITRNQTKAAKLKRQTKGTNFSPGELSAILGKEHESTSNKEEEPMPDWDKLLGEIDALADYLLYDNWRGIADEDKSRRIVGRRKKMR